MTNDIFRMVGLRHSRSSTADGATSADPRLRYRTVLEGQARVSPTLHENKLRDLRNRHAALSKKIAQLEAVHVAVVDAYNWEQQGKPVPRPKPGADPKSTRPAATRAAAPAASAPAAAVAAPIVDRQKFAQRVEAKLDEKQTALFRNLFTDQVADLGDLINGLQVGSFINEANSLCAQIQAVNVNLGDDLPTVSNPAGSAAAPIVAAVGWGDLIVAKETLVGYDAHEISHIENILPGESKLRELRRLSKTEEVAETETITEKETEKDSQTTDRYELQAQSQESIDRNFAVTAGVNTSGKYGLTQVDTSLDAAFSQSQSESRSSSINTARDIVTKAVERTYEKVRVLRRLTITEQIRELNRHKLENSGGTGTPKAISGIYLWVEKIQKVELRQYGTRMMVEFHIPEPALTLLERAAVRNTTRRLPPFNVSPSEIHPGNYMCLAEQYGAVDVEPPPTLFIEVGWGWTSTANEDAESWAEDQFTSTINIPAGYRPTWAKVAWSALRGKTENREFNFAFSIGGKSQGIEHTVLTYDGVVLGMDLDADWPQGVPVSGRLHGAWDGAMYIQANLKCIRTNEALDAWRLKTWQALRAGYETLERKVAQEQQQQAYQQSLLAADASEKPAQENRRIERNELQKWAIKSMRLVPQNFNAIEQVGDMQEVSPAFAEAQAPIVRFYEDAFEWEHMNYFLYPYHWARRASWKERTSAEAADPLHQAFLEAGAARVIVPVTPGFEDKVAWFLDPANAATAELDRVLATPPSSAPSSTSDTFRDLWIELLTDRKPDSARGSGTLRVVQGNAVVKINADSEWKVSEHRDVGRELFIAGDRYEVASVGDEHTFELDRPFLGSDDANARYVAGSVPFGAPWTVTVPTSLIVLSENVPALKAV